MAVNPYSNGVIRYWVNDSDRAMPARELLKWFFPWIDNKNSQRFKESLLERTEKYGAFNAVYIRGLTSPVYFPDNVSVTAMTRIINEVMNPNNPHFYEQYGTEVEEDIVLDCGAAEGLFSLSVLERSKRVYLAEPLPQFQASMKLTFNGRSNVEIVPFVLGCRKSMVDYAYREGEDIFLSGVSSSPSNMVLEQHTIDELFYEANKEVTYVKVDVEGSELELIEGAEKTIRANHPKIAISTYHKRDHAARLIGMLHEMYKGYRFVTNGFFFEREDTTPFPIMLHASVR
jgi:FkbM family methyltransferase